MRTLGDHVSRKVVRSGAGAPWVATGDAGEDLPEWALLGGPANIASASADCHDLSGLELEAAAHAAFASALARLGRAPMRVWAFLPRITDPDSNSIDRYMRMNRGRACAYGAASLPFIPAGTCTGHAGGSLVVHALAATSDARPVENPRQRPAWCYSSRFGPQSPPFTRGVVANGVLIASGTASVVGEETMHIGNPREQWDETVCNLESLSVSAGVSGEWRCLRIYVREARHLDLLATLARSVFGNEVDSVLLAPLCREDLLVEVEGIKRA